MLFRSSFVHFEIKDLEIIAEHREHSGVRANLIGHIKNTRTPFSIDFGVGDIVIPAPSKRTLPVLISDFEKPTILTYSFESVIAEKFDAIISRMELTSRMKDFFDIYFLASTVDFEGRKLQEAMNETLKNRGTSYERDSLKRISELSKDKDMMTRWKAFCKKTLRRELNFAEVIELMVKFLEQPYGAILDESEYFGIWKSNEKMYNLEN